MQSWEVRSLEEQRYAAGTENAAEMRQHIADAPRLRTIYIVPKPELRVSGRQ